jgi:hypothetical protein
MINRKMDHGISGNPTGIMPVSMHYLFFDNWPIRMLRELSKRTEKQRAGYCHVAGMAVVSPISLTGQNPVVDLVYFHVGGFVGASYLKVADNLNNEEILVWSHAMDPTKSYS